MNTRSKGFEALQLWLKGKNWKLQPFQKETLEAYLAGKSGLLNAPTGSGKTYALWFPILVDHINQSKGATTISPGLRVLWITPLRALAKDLHRNMQLAAEGLNVEWKVGIRTSDISAKERQLQKKTNAGSHDHYT